MNRKSIGLLMVYLIGFSAIFGFAMEKKEEVFKIAIQPTTKPVVSLKRYQPLVDYLKEKTGLNIELAITANYGDFADLQKDGKVDFVIQDVFSAFLINKHIKLIPMANIISPEGKTYDPGYIIVKADGDIKELSDLKGKKLLFGPKANAAKFLAPYIFLKKSGIDVEKDLYYEFGGMCPHNAMSVFLGEYDAGLVCGLYMAQKEKKFNFQNDLRVLAKTEDRAPYWIVSAYETTDGAVANKIKRALLELDMENPRTAEVFSVCKWKGFAKYSDEINMINMLVEKYDVPN
jgi:phosphonate transport system substrate-binding protein